jgi:hypothetical protein
LQLLAECASLGSHLAAGDQRPGGTGHLVTAEADDLAGGEEDLGNSLAWDAAVAACLRPEDGACRGKEGKRPREACTNTQALVGGRELEEPHFDRNDGQRQVNDLQVHRVCQCEGVGR